MNAILSITEDNVDTQVVELAVRFDKEISLAEPLFKIEGERIEVICRLVPQHQAHYALLESEAEAVVEWLETFQSKIEARLMKNYTGGNRAFGARELQVLISGDEKMVAIKQNIILMTSKRRAFSDIKDAFNQLGWQLKNVVNLRTAEMKDAIF